MKTPLLILGAAGLLFAAPASHAAPSELQRYADRAGARAQTLLAATGLDLRTQHVSVRASVDLDGHLSSIRVVRSSGSPRTDHAVEGVLRKIVMAEALIGLTGAAVTLNAGAGPAEAP
jgi:hypothetical protein